MKVEEEGNPSLPSIDSVPTPARAKFFTISAVKGLYVKGERKRKRKRKRSKNGEERKEK